MDSWSTVTNSSGFLGIPAAALPSVVHELYAINYNIVAGSALLVWDMLLTLDQEVQYIWKSKLSLITALFGVIRLLAAGGQIAFLTFNLSIMRVADSYCRNVAWFQGMLGLIMFVFVDMLLIWRLYALYGRTKALLVSLCILEFLLFIAVMVLFSIGLPKFHIVPNPFPREIRTGVCVLLGYPNIVPDIWSPLLPVQFILFSLAVGRYIYLPWRSSMPFRSIFNTSHVYYTFIRDGVWTFFVLLVIIIMCTLGNSLRITLGPAAIQWCYPAIGVCASRLVLNLRSANEQPQFEAHLSPVIFQEPHGTEMNSRAKNCNISQSFSSVQNSYEVV